MKTNESEEMYLESIYLLSSVRQNVRAVDIREDMNFAKSSVSKALSLLTQKNYIIIDDFGNITLTKEGLDKAQSIYEKHKIITTAFMMMGAPLYIAEDNACRVEHVLSDELFNIIKEKYKK